jgi:hypothetical protein
MGKLQLQVLASFLVQVQQKAQQHAVPTTKLDPSSIRAWLLLGAVWHLR